MFIIIIIIIIITIIVQALNYLGMVFQVVFLEAAEAKAAFRGLAYKRYK